MDEYNSQIREKNSHAEKRAEQGKPPKVEKGEAKRIEKEKAIMGTLAEGLLNNIRLLEIALDQQMFFAIGIPTRDGRVLTVSMQPKEEKNEPLG